MTGNECSGATPVCLEPVSVPGIIPAIPKIGSTSAICQVEPLFIGENLDVEKNWIDREIS